MPGERRILASASEGATGADVAIAATGADADMAPTDADTAQDSNTHDAKNVCAEQGVVLPLDHRLRHMSFWDGIPRGRCTTQSVWWTRFPRLGRQWRNFRLLWLLLPMTVILRLRNRYFLSTAVSSLNRGAPAEDGVAKKARAPSDQHGQESGLLSTRNRAKLHGPRAKEQQRPLPNSLPST